MNLKQRILKFVYPALMKVSRQSSAHGSILENREKQKPLQSIYHYSLLINNGSTLALQQLAGKKILLVNTASACGYTNQYTELQELADHYSGKLMIIGFPANDFKEQEKGSDTEIAQFCSRNFGVQFPLVKKSSVIKGPGQHPVFKWLTTPEQNGWNSHQPDWNFSKYLLNEEGILTHYFGPAIAPLGKEVQAALKN